MRVLLRLLLLLQGLVITVLSAGIIFSGPKAMYSWISNLAGLDATVLEGLNANFLDGSMRAYAVLFLVFGLIVLNVARDFNDNFKLIPVLMAILFLCGIARLWSAYSIGDRELLTMIEALAEILPATLILMLYFLCGKEDRY